jgi:pSer/pThr/pTyr-binding forkhead associated (FHA) protein
VRFHRGSLIPLAGVMITQLCYPINRFSRHHGVLEGKGDYFILRDLESTNGTFKDGIKISELPLRDSAKFRIGSCNMEIVSRETELSPSEAGPSDTMIFEIVSPGLWRKWRIPVWQRRLPI